MNGIWQFWNVLTTPSDHEGDPYVEAANQLSHIALGCVFSLSVCVIWFTVAGEMPVRLTVWLTVVMGYAIGVEWWLQGWNGRDSFIDTFFVQCGVSMTLWPVKEVGFSPDVALIEVRPKFLGILMLISTMALILHLLPRIKRYFNA